MQNRRANAAPLAFDSQFPVFVLVPACDHGYSSSGVRSFLPSESANVTSDAAHTFNTNMLGSLVAYSLIETLFHGDLFADGIQPVIHQWLVDFNTLEPDLKDHKLKDARFPGQARRTLPQGELARFAHARAIRSLEKSAKFPDNGARASEST